MNKRALNPFLYVAGSMICVGTAHADGLGGLQVIGTLFLILGIVIGGGVLVLIPYLIQKNKAGAGKQRINKFALFISILYLLGASPVFITIVVNPRLNAVMYFIAALYLAVLAATLLQFFTNKRYVFGSTAIIFLVIVFRSPEIVSYTEYTVIDNNPLAETVELSDQKDNEYIHLADGRIFRFKDRYNSSGLEEKFDNDTKFIIEATSESKDNGIYYLHGIRVSQKYYHIKITDVQPFFTIPIRNIELNKNESYHIGMIELLDANWKADNHTLTRAIIRNCCDSAWVDELIRRGADPNRIMIGSRNVLHYLASEVAYYDGVDSVTAVVIKFGVDLNAKDEWGKTPLHVAINEIWRSGKNQPRNKDRYKAFLTVLLESGADPNAIDKYGYTPLYSTIINRQFELSRLLLEYGADPGQETSKNKSPYELFYKRYMDAGSINTDEEFAKLVIELNKRIQKKVGEGG